MDDVDVPAVGRFIKFHGIQAIFHKGQKVGIANARVQCYPSNDQASKVDDFPISILTQVIHILINNHVLMIRTSPHDLFHLDDQNHDQMQDHASWENCVIQFHSL